MLSSFLKRFILLVAVSLAGFTISSGKDHLTQTIPSGMAGTYELFNLEDQKAGEMIITDWGDNTFIVRGNGWVGYGSIVNEKGYYDWKFDDGKSGRTNFLVNAKGELEGHVKGSGLDWHYIAKKKVL